GLGARRPAASALVGGAAASATGVLLLVLGPQLGRPLAPLRVDLSAGRLNTPAPATRAAFGSARGALSAELVITPRARMPASLKGLEERVRSLLQDLRVPQRVQRPAHLSAAQVRALAGVGLRSFSAQTVAQDTLAAQPIWAGLRLRLGEREAVIGRLDARRAEHLEFLLRAALRRLQEGRAPRLAVVSDVPQLSPAEVLEDYQRRGLSAPSGTDAYGQAKEMLAGYGYDVAHVSARRPRLPDSADVFLWLQPRRDSRPVQRLLAEHLHRGGRAILAVQHYAIQQRQYRGAGFATVYWPQPQFADVGPYLEELGVAPVREVLMDRTRHPLSLETQVNRGPVREHDPQQVALPFLIRAVAGHHAPDSPLTRRLGDLLFPWGNRFALDSGKLAHHGLQARVLVTTSDQAWAYPWQGGWLPPEVLRPSALLPGRQPLVLEVRGTFPPVVWPEGPADAGLVVGAEPSPGQPEGALVLVGCSEMFKDEHLYRAGFQHDQLLLNAVALLAWGEEMAQVQARRPAPRGFALQPEGARLAWRAAVIGGGPLLFVLVGLAHQRWRIRRAGAP
ncbi:MAG: Gldg family protein, partial [Candidatus Latescibacterota bacterium]